MKIPVAAALWLAAAAAQADEARPVQGQVEASSAPASPSEEAAPAKADPAAPKKVRSWRAAIQELKPAPTAVLQSQPIETPAVKPADGEQRIVVYAKADCSACRRVRRWFQTRRIAYYEVNVGESTRAAAALQEKRARQGIHHALLPAIEIDGVILKSVHPKAIRAALDKSNAKAQRATN